PQPSRSRCRGRPRGLCGGRGAKIGAAGRQSGWQSRCRFRRLFVASSHSIVEPKEDGVRISGLIPRTTVACCALIVAAAGAAAAGAMIPDPSPRAPAPARPVAARLAVQPALVGQLALARAATAKYVADLGRAKADGYRIITRMLPSMGYHFMNPAVKGFDVRKPPILVYEHRGSSWQLGALEWVFTSKPARPPLPGATYGAFGAGCHY